MLRWAIFQVHAPDRGHELALYFIPLYVEFDLRFIAFSIMPLQYRGACEIEVKRPRVALQQIPRFLAEVSCGETD